MTTAEINAMRAEHTDDGEGFCITCVVASGFSPDGDPVPCPCVPARLLAELDHRAANPPTWQGRNHRSPVPHLAQFAGRPDPWQPEHDAAVARGLLGPVSSEELAR